MHKYKVTIIIESDEDPSAIMDAFEDAVDGGSLHVEVRLDEESVEDGVAITVEDVA